MVEGYANNTSKMENDLDALREIIIRQLTNTTGYEWWKNLRRCVRELDLGLKLLEVMECHVGKHSNLEQKKEIVYCSFCGLPQVEVKKLIEGPKASICDNCVELMVEIVRQDVDSDFCK